MGYKVLGFLVWRGGRFYLKRKFPDAPKKLAVGGAIAAGVGAGAIAVSRSRSGSE
jgi:hypothetical protein